MPVKSHRNTLIVACGLAFVALISIVGCGRTRPTEPAANMSVVNELRKTADGPVATAVVAATGTGWGTIKGRLVFEGNVPEAARLNVDKDLEVCGKHALVDESLVVGPNKGLANVALFLRSKTRIHPDTAKAATGKVIYDNHGCRFEPHVLAFALTQEFVIKNSDAVGHNSNIAPTGDQAANPLVTAHTEQPITFKRTQNEGVSVTCNIHPWMKGYILPRDNPYFAVTKNDGAFEIQNVPAGEELEFQFWHERAPRGLEVDSSWAKGRKKLKVEDTKTLDLGEIKIATTALK